MHLALRLPRRFAGTRWLALLALGCLLAVFGAACAGGTSAASAQTFTVNMPENLKFDPETLTVPKGATVTWKNTSQVQHTVTDDPSKAANKADSVLPSGAQPWDSGMIDPGQSWSHTFDTPGNYTYFCIPHEMAGMVAKITVTN